MEAEALQEGRAIFSIDLHPAYASNALEGVRLQMESRLLRWDGGLGGVLLAYKNLDRLPSEASIRPYFPYIHLRVAADVLIFAPKKGAVLCGQVTKVGADFIGMTILGSINAAVGRQNIRPALQYDSQTASWGTPGQALSMIEVGSDALFTVERLRIDSNGILAVLGAMKEPWTGSAKAAAHRLPAAFPDPLRWQRMEPLALTVRMFEAAPTPGHADELEGAEPVRLIESGQPAKPQSPESPEPLKKKKRKSETASVDVKASAVPNLPASDGKPAKKKRKKALEGQLANGDAAAQDPAEPVRKEMGTKKAKDSERQQQPQAVSPGLWSGAKAENRGAKGPGGGVGAALGSPEKEKKKKKQRRTSESVL